LPFSINYHPKVKSSDIVSLDQKTKKRLKRAIEKRLMIEPHRYGRPLRKTLKGYWKLRVGDYRIVFKILEKEIRVLGICHRKDVYKKMKVRKESA